MVWTYWDWLLFKNLPSMKLQQIIGKNLLHHPHPVRKELHFNLKHRVSLYSASPLTHLLESAERDFILAVYNNIESTGNEALNASSSEMCSTTLTGTLKIKFILDIVCFAKRGARSCSKFCYNWYYSNTLQSAKTYHDKLQSWLVVRHVSTHSFRT